MTNRASRFGTKLRQSTGLYVLIALTGLLFAACGQQPPPEEDPPEAAVALELSAATVTLLRGGEVTVAVTVTRTGAATGAAELSVAGTIPAGVSATFDPPELTGTQLVSQLTLTADASAAPATLTLEVVADVGESSANHTLAVGIEGLTVTGRVEDDFGRPLPGGRAGSQGQTVLVNAAGEFTLTNLAVPYDLMLGSGPEGRLHVFEGLRSDRPVLVPWRMFDEPAGGASAGLSGELVAGALGAKEGAVICAEGTKVVIHFCERLDAGDDDFSFNVVWFGAPQQTATLHAFKFQTDGAEAIVEYLGYTSTDATLLDGGAVEWDLEFGPVGQSQLTGEVVQGSGITVGPLMTAAVLRIGKHLSVLVDVEYDQADFELAVPDPPGAATNVAVVVWDGFGSSTNSVAWRTGLARTAGTIELLDVPGGLGPAAGDDGVDHATTFAIGGQPGQVKVFTWTAVADTKPLIAVTTTRDVVTIPDPGALGLGGMLPLGTELRWYVNSLWGQDVDDATTAIRRAREVLGPLYDLGGVMDGQEEVVQLEGEEFVFGPR